MLLFIVYKLDLVRPSHAGVPRACAKAYYPGGCIESISSLALAAALHRSRVVWWGRGCRELGRTSAVD